MPNELDLRVTLGKERMPVSQNTQLEYVLIDATPVPTLSAEPMPLNFCFVLDHSGSMDGPKLDNVKAAVKLLVDRMRPEDLVSVVIFDDTAQVVVPSQPVANRDAIKQAVDKVREGGGTQMSQGMNLGLDELRKGVSPDRVSRMLLLTDGQTWGDEVVCRQRADEAAGLGIPITALGVGDEWNEKLLDELATKTNGASDFIETPDKIIPFFEQALKRAQSTKVLNANLTLRVVSGVNPRAVYRVRPDIRNLGTKYLSDRYVSVPLGDLGAEGAALLVELMVPPRSAGPYRMAQAEVEYTLPGAAQTTERVKEDVVVNFTADPNDTGGINPQVMNLAEKVSAFKLQTRAFQEAEAGNIAGATQKLRSAATRLLNLGEVELAQAAQQEASNLEHQGAMSSTGTKRLNYSTRRLTAVDLDAAQALSTPANGNTQTEPESLPAAPQGDTGVPPTAPQQTPAPPGDEDKVEHTAPQPPEVEPLEPAPAEQSGNESGQQSGV